MTESELHFRLEGALRRGVIPLDSLQSVSAPRRDDIVPTLHYQLNFEGQKPLLLDENRLSNVGPLIERMQGLVRAEATAEPVIEKLPSLPDDEERVDLIRMYFEHGEKCLWVGSPQPRLLQGELRGMLALGLLLVVSGLGMSAVFIAIALNQQRLGNAFGAIPGVVFVLVGAHQIRRSFRARAIILRTIYAVTDRRAWILNGVFRGTLDSFESEEGQGIRSYEPEQLEAFEIASGGRDLIFERRPGPPAGRRSRLVGYGFIACDDMANAIRAIRWLLQEHDLVSEPMPSVAS
jgi:hypothetical protein